VLVTLALCSRHYRRHIFSRRPSPLPSAARLPSEAQNHPPRDLYTVREGFSCRHGCSSPAHTDDFRGLPQLLAHRTERGADRARGILTKNSDARVQSAPTAPRDRLHPQSIFLGFLSASLLAPHPACRIERRRLPLPTQRPASPPPPPLRRTSPPVPRTLRLCLAFFFSVRLVLAAPCLPPFRSK